MLLHVTVLFHCYAVIHFTNTLHFIHSATDENLNVSILTTINKISMNILGHAFGGYMYSFILSIYPGVIEYTCFLNLLG